SIPAIDTIGKSLALVGNDAATIFTLLNGTGNATLTNNVLSLTGIGTISITGTLVETANYLSASLTKELLIINNGTQSTTGIDLIEETFSYYPNPVSDLLFIQNINTSTLNKISLVNALGLEIESTFTKTEEGITIDLSTLPNGTFILKLYFKDQLRMKKILVVH
ncbi:MAG: T9SS type A sorting domain-containing protein, partial [Cytophagales bacterium]